VLGWRVRLWLGPRLRPVDVNPAPPVAAMVAPPPLGRDDRPYPLTCPAPAARIAYPPTAPPIDSPVVEVEAIEVREA
jgi:hypothetical protein